MNYGKGIKIARAIAGIQQKDLAGKAGIDASHVSMIEMGKRQPSMIVVNKISAALGMPPHLLALLSADHDDVAINDPEELKRAAASLAHLVLGNGGKKRIRRSKKLSAR
jgi:transcriptional regulator with XRE-family HTH domain